MRRPAFAIDRLPRKVDADTIRGGPPTVPEAGDAVAGVVEWVDGTLLDCIRLCQTETASYAMDVET